MLRRLPIALLLLVSAVAFADDVWTPETMILERNPGDVAVSPCGRWVAYTCLLYTSPSPRDRTRSRMPSSA